MESQVSIFDIMFSYNEAQIPQPDSEGRIKAEDLIPIQWMAWKHPKNSYQTIYDCRDAYAVLFSGNRVLVKDWMLYPHMEEYESTEEAYKEYEKARKKIETANSLNDKDKMWVSEELPEIEDMYQYEEGKYSCREFVEKIRWIYPFQTELNKRKYFDNISDWEYWTLEEWTLKENELDETELEEEYEF